MALLENSCSALFPHSPTSSRVHPPLLCTSTNPDLPPSSAELDSSLRRAAPFARRRLIPPARPSWIRACDEPRRALDVASVPQHRDESAGHGGQCQEVELGPASRFSDNKMAGGASCLGWVCDSLIRQPGAPQLLPRWPTPLRFRGRRLDGHSDLLIPVSGYSHLPLFHPRFRLLAPPLPF
jgi:hypothetical protein